MPAYIYQLVGKKLRIELPWELEILGESAEFLAEDCGGAYDDCVVFHEVDELPRMPEDAFPRENKVYASVMGSPAVFLKRYSGDPPYALLRFEEDAIHLDYLRGSEFRIASSLSLLNFLGLEQILFRYDAMILHASFVRYSGVGILFSAPSGTGKSTQAELWETYMHSETLNGDRAGLRLVNGIWTAHGLPYAGSSKIYRNESAPVRAIVALAQGKENVIRKLTPIEALRRLMPEFSLHHWDISYMNHALNLISSLLTEIPVYLLTCRPDEDAVNLLAETLELNKTTKEAST